MDVGDVFGKSLHDFLFKSKLAVKYLLGKPVRETLQPKFDGRPLSEISASLWRTDPESLKCNLD